MRRNLITALLAVLFTGQGAMAASCPPSPSLTVQNYPGAERIPKGNNLVMPTGKAVEADGQRVVIYGQLLDSKCVPVSEAIVELWQVDPFGKWVLATREDLVNPNPVFAGAGRTRTDNDGRFHFVTLFPAALKQRAPHFNLRISARGQKAFTTQLYFADDGRNDADIALKRLKPEQRARLQMQVNEAGAAGLGAAVTLVMPYAQRYRGY